MVKLIVAGAVPAGGLAVLASKVAKLHASAHGPFDLVLVTSLTDEAGLQAAINGAAFPVPLAFAAAEGEPIATVAACLRHGSEATASSNITYLGDAGVATVQGLCVAFASSLADDASYPELVKQLGELASSGGGRPQPSSCVDVLLSPRCPLGVLRGVPPSATPDAARDASARGVQGLAHVARIAEPRYHLCGGHGDGAPATFFQRAPYTNPSLIPTRFISLAPVPLADTPEGNKGEAKHLHALNLQPASTLDVRALTEQPPGCTHCPYVGAAVAAAALAAASAGRGLAAATSGSAEEAPGGGDTSGVGDEDGSGPGPHKRLRIDGAAPFSSAPAPQLQSSAAPLSGLTADRVASLQAESQAAATGQQQFFWSLRGGRGGRGGGGARHATGANAGPLNNGPEDPNDPICPKHGFHRVSECKHPDGPPGPGVPRPLDPNDPPCPKHGGHRTSECKHPGGAPGPGVPRPLDPNDPICPKHGGHRTSECKHPGGAARPKAAAAPAECWFCLASPHVEKHLILAIGNECYVALPKGGVNADHVLVVPIEHCDALATAPDSLRDESRRFLDSLGRMFAAQGKGMCVFERVLHAQREGQRPSHTHYQVFGLSPDAAARAKDTFLTEGAFRYVPLTELPGDVSLEDRVTRGAAAPGSGAGEPEYFVEGVSTCEYLYVEVPAGPVPAASEDTSAAGGGGAGDSRPAYARLLHRVPLGAKHPVQFGREVLCRLLNLPDRLSWKTCVDSVEKETSTTEGLRAAFAPYDFTAEL